MTCVRKDFQLYEHICWLKMAQSLESGRWLNRTVCHESEETLYCMVRSGKLTGHIRRFCAVFAAFSSKPLLAFMAVIG